jgi:sialic acid synthase SpsE
MAAMFDCLVGLSDHTMGIGVAIASVVLGASVIEKHFTLNRADGGVDSAFSMEPQELKALVEGTEIAFRSLGRIQYGVQESERNSIRFKRSIYVVKDMAEGEAFSETNIRVIRPGDGLAPKYFEFIIGKKAKKSLRRGEPLNWDNLL